jgi:hypothetical protein
LDDDEILKDEDKGEDEGEEEDEADAESPPHPFAQLLSFATLP